MRRVTLLSSLLLLASLPGCDRGGAAPVAAEPPPVQVGPENVAVVREQQLVSGPLVSGQLEAENTAEVRAQSPGQVLSVEAREGQKVEKGQVIVRIDEAASRDQVASARAGVASAESALAVAKASEERARTLAEKGALAQKDLELAEQQRAQAEAALSAARAQLASASDALGRTRAVAPFDGIVSERQVNPGDVVQPGTPLFTVVDPGRMLFQAAVPAQALGQVHADSDVAFTLSGYGDRSFRGKVTRISPSVTPGTGLVPIWISVPNEEGALVAGLFAQGRVAAESVTAPAVPEEAIDRRGLTPSVAAVQGGRVQRVPVQVGLRDAVQEMLAVSGVAPGTVVLSGSAADLADGTKVELPPLPPAPGAPTENTAPAPGAVEPKPVPTRSE